MFEYKNDNLYNIIWHKLFSKRDRFKEYNTLRYKMRFTFINLNLINR